MKKITFEITGTVALAGHNPGDVFLVDANDDGTPVELYWRKRLSDESRCACGAVRVVPNTAEPEVSPDPAPAAPARKGR